MHDLVPLSLLPTGHAAHIDTIVGQAASVHRLHELGMKSGELVQMVQPGNTCIVRLAGQKLCLRMDDLAQVLVRPERAT